MCLKGHVESGEPETPISDVLEGACFMRTKSYIFMLTDVDRKRHEHVVQKGEIKDFVVQYEMKIGNKWLPVVRFDTAHGYTHKDLINPDGTKEKILMGDVSYNEILTEADKDIKGNWPRYRERFLRRMKDG